MRNACFIAILLILVSSKASGLDRSFPLAWQIQTDHGGLDTARSVAISDTTTVIGELLAAPDGGIDLSVAAYDLATGAMRWENHVPSFPGVISSIFVTTAGDTAFALAYVSGPEISSTDLFLRAYSISTGNVLWTNFWNAGRDDFPRGIAVANGRVTIVGYGGNVAPGEHLHGLVRTLDAVSGAPIWESEISNANADDLIWSVDSNDSIVVTAGSRFDGTQNDLMLRGYRAATGRLLWETRIAGVLPEAMQLRGGRAFVVGSEQGTAINTFLAAFDINTGAQIWRSAAIAGSLVDLDAKNGQVVAVGSADNASVILSADPMTGAILWSNVSRPDPGFREFFNRVVVNNRGIFAVGSAAQDFVYSEMLLRGFALTGDVLLDDRSHRSAAGSNAFNDVAVGGRSLVAVGQAFNSTYDAVIRVFTSF